MASWRRADATIAFGNRRPGGAELDDIDLAFTPPSTISWLLLSFGSISSMSMRDSLTFDTKGKPFRPGLGDRFDTEDFHTAHAHTVTVERR